MEKIDLNNVAQVEIYGRTSKGNQAKWKIKNRWIKADQLGYEALAEVVVSRLLKYSNVKDFVVYKPTVLQLDGKERIGCTSTNFLKSGELLLPFERFHRMYTAYGLSQTLAKMADAEKRIKYTVDFIEEHTDLTDVGQYLTTLLELDCFTLNEDRHTNNLAVIQNEQTGKFRLCPIFDNGLALLSDINEYALDDDIYTNVRKVKAKPFDTDFDLQIEAAWGLYGSQLEFSFDRYRVSEILADLREYYDERIIKRAEAVLLEQMRKYQVLFK